VAFLSKKKVKNIFKNAILGRRRVAFNKNFIGREEIL
jgi:hypothetical protein